jgi:hypothetical protein
MTHLRATFDYRLRRLLIQSALLGSNLPLTYEGHEVELVFPIRSMQPETVEWAMLEPELFPPDDPAIAPPSAVAILNFGASPAEDRAVVNALRVFVHARDEAREAAEVLTRLRPVADAVVRRLTAWLRVEGKQPWLGLAGDMPEGVGVATIDNLDAQRRFPITSRNEPLVVHKVRDEQIIGLNTLTDVLERVTAGAKPTIADSSLADALFFLEVVPPDHARAVLSAAIACEVKVREVIRARVSPPAAPVLDVFLSNPRDHSLAAAQYFSSLMKAVTGHSLDRDTDPSFREVERLFTLRNRVAHGGLTPAPADARTAVGTAVRAFRWLQTVQNAD